VSSSDAKLFCKNNQVNLKNNPKLGNLTKKQAQHVSGKTIQQDEKSAGKLNRKSGRDIRKIKPKVRKSSQKHAQITFDSKLKQQTCHKIWNESKPQNRGLQKTSKISIKQAQKQETHKSK